EDEPLARRRGRRGARGVAVHAAREPEGRTAARLPRRRRSRRGAALVRPLRRAAARTGRAGRDRALRGVDGGDARERGAGDLPPRHARPARRLSPTRLSTWLTEG